MFAEPTSAASPSRAPTRAFRLPWTSYVELVRTRAESEPDRVALFGIPKLEAAGPKLTWAAMDRRIRALAATLQDAGAAGQPVILLLENDPLYLVSFFACAYAGAIAVPMPPLAHARHLGRLVRVLEDCGARLVVSTRDVQARCVDVPNVRWILADTVPEGAEWTEHYPLASDPAFLQYTSGSTSAPKGVVVRHADLVFQGEIVGSRMELGPEDRALVWMPMFHDLGLICGALVPLYWSVPVAIATPAAFVKAPGKWLQAISDLRITVSGGPNFAYDLCADTVDPAALRDLDLSCLNQTMNAAEPVRAGTIDRFCAKFGPYGFRREAMQPGYGLAEATVGVALTHVGREPARRKANPLMLAAGRVVDTEDDDARILVSSGKPFAGVDVRIVDPEFLVPLPPDTIGEIWASSDHFPETYWKLPSPEVFQAHPATDPTGRRFLRTGDLGFLDADGNLTITGRRKDLIIVAGKNHYPQDIELTVEEASPAVRRNFVAAFAVEVQGREAVVVVAEVRREATKEEIAAAAAAIQRAAAERHELALHAVALVEHGQVPKTTSGKIQRARCREMWTAREFRGIA